MAAQLRPDLSDALSALERTIDAARATELADWPPATRGALVAEIEHLRRVVELLPSFGDYLEQTILPGYDRSRADLPYRARRSRRMFYWGCCRG